MTMGSLFISPSWMVHSSSWLWVKFNYHAYENILNGEDIRCWVLNKYMFWHLRWDWCISIGSNYGHEQDYWYMLKILKNFAHQLVECVLKIICIGHVHSLIVRGGFEASTWRLINYGVRKLSPKQVHKFEYHSLFQLSSFDYIWASFPTFQPSHVPTNILLSVTMSILNCIFH